MSLLPVSEALQRILQSAQAMPTEAVAINKAAGRILAEPLSAKLTQPPFAASSMDGFAVRAGDLMAAPATLNVVGQSAAGHGFDGEVTAGQAVRIFTGAPVPAGADAVVMQEDTHMQGGDVVIEVTTTPGNNVRPVGFDFSAGTTLLSAGTKLGPRTLALAAAMGHGELPVRRRPVVALLATGDELVPPGTTPGRDQIVASNPLGIAALVDQAGGRGQDLGIAADTFEILDAHIARSADADIVVTIGGASVGDHDLVGPVLKARGMALDFWKIAMRPGKPLMYGKLGEQCVLGLPGNPVSALVCARVFLVPLIWAMLGYAAEKERSLTAKLDSDLDQNGPRQHYMRAALRIGGDGASVVVPVRSQDSSLLAPLSEADCLLVRPSNAPALRSGDAVPVLMLDF